MSRFSFQIEPTAEFQCLKANSVANGLRAKLFGKTGSAERTPVTAPVVPSNQGTAIRTRKSAARGSLRKRTSGELRFVRSGLSRSERPPQSTEAVLSPLLNQVKYKGHVISAAQIEDGGWIATHRRIGGDLEAANAPAVQMRNSYLARALAIADAELEIDEIEAQKLHAMRARFQDHSHEV